MTDLMQALTQLRPYLEKRCDQLVGHTENSPEEEELKAISDVLDAMGNMEAA